MAHRYHHQHPRVPYPAMYDDDPVVLGAMPNVVSSSSSRLSVSALSPSSSSSEHSGGGVRQHHHHHTARGRRRYDNDTPSSHSHSQSSSSSSRSNNSRQSRSDQEPCTTDTRGTTTPFTTTTPSAAYYHQPPILTLLGAQGPTGRHLVRLALDAGYGVKALITDEGLLLSEYGGAGQEQPLELFVLSNDRQQRSEASEGPWLDTAENRSKVRRCLQGARYVVCLLGETFGSSSAGSSSKSQKKPHNTYQEGFLPAVVQRLYPLLRQETSLRLFVYQVCLASFPRKIPFICVVSDCFPSSFLIDDWQATSLAADVQGRTPLFSQACKTVLGVSRRLLRRQRPASIYAALTRDHDQVILYLAQQHGLVPRAVPLTDQQENDNVENQKPRSTTQPSSRRGSSVAATSTASTQPNNQKKKSAPKPSLTSSTLDTTPPHFDFVITRPTVLIKEGPSTQALSASKSVRFDSIIQAVSCLSLSVYAMNAILTPHRVPTFLFTATRSLLYYACGLGRLYPQCSVGSQAGQHVPLCRGRLKCV